MVCNMPNVFPTVVTLLFSEHQSQVSAFVFLLPVNVLQHVSCHRYLFLILHVCATTVVSKLWPVAFRKSCLSIPCCPKPFFLPNSLTPDSHYIQEIRVQRYLEWQKKNTKHGQLFLNAGSNLWARA